MNVECHMNNKDVSIIYLHRHVEMDIWHHDILMTKIHTMDNHSTDTKGDSEMSSFRKYNVHLIFYFKPKS